MSIEDVGSVTEQLGRAFETFKSHYAEKFKNVEELERKVNRLSVSAGADSRRTVYTAEEHKALASGIKAMIRNDQATANRFFAEAGGESKAGSYMQVGVDSGGGYLVNPQFSRETTRVMLESAPVLEQVRTVPLLSGDSLEEIEDLQSAEANWVGETETRNDTTTPDIGKFQAFLRELCAMPKVSQKLIDTADIDVVEWLSDKVGEQFGFKVATAIFSGNGITQPRGILTYSTAATADATRTWGTIEHIVTGASGAFLTTAVQADCLQDTVASLKSQYRRGAVWMMNRRTMATIRKMKEATTNAYVWQPGLQLGIPDSLLGYPVVEAEQMPDMAANSLSIAFGNFKKAYTVVTGPGIRFLVDPYTAKPFVRLYAYQRIGGAMNNSEAIKLVKFST